MGFVRNRGASPPSMINRRRVTHKPVAAFARAVEAPNAEWFPHRAHAVNHTSLAPFYVTAARTLAFTPSVIHRLRHGQTMLPNPAFERTRISMVGMRVMFSVCGRLRARRSTLRWALCT